MSTKDPKTEWHSSKHSKLSQFHQTRFWNPKMSPFIFGSNSKAQSQKIERALPLFEDAVSFIRNIAANNGSILFVGTKRAARESIREYAMRSRMPFVNQRWLGGMLTNFKTVRQSIRRLKELEKIVQNRTIDTLNKKKVLSLIRELDKLEKSLGGIKNMHGLPDALLIVDISHERIAAKEAEKLGIPVIGLVNDDVLPAGADYIIPGNCDSIKAISIFLASISNVISESSNLKDFEIESKDTEINELRFLVAELMSANKKAEKALLTAQVELKETLAALRTQRNESEEN